MEAFSLARSSKRRKSNGATEAKRRMRRLAETEKFHELHPSLSGLSRGCILPPYFSSLAFTCVAGEAVSFNSFPSSIRASGEQHSWPCLREGTSFPFVFPCSLLPSPLLSPGGRPPTHPKDQR